jgi:heterodisulfide reductase subunit C
MSYKNLRAAVNDLEKTGQLRRIKIEIDPDLDMAEIHRRVYDAQGPALLFERVKGSPFQAVSNIYGTYERTDFLFRHTIRAVEKVIELKLDPTNFLKNPMRYLGAPFTALKALPMKLPLSMAASSYAETGARTSEITKSSLLIQKEHELKELQKKKEKVTKSIKTTKTKIETLQIEAESATKSMMNGMQRMADLSILAKEIKSLLKDLKKKVKLSRKDKDELEEVITHGILEDITDDLDDAFAQTPFGSAENFNSRQFNAEERANDFTDEFNRQRRQEMFGEFIVKPTEAEQQAIRKVYVHLAGRFHPDKADGEAELKLFHDLMQSINGAYQRGDLDELLEIQKRFVDYKTADAGTSDYDIPILDVLDEQILRYRNELNLLESQNLRLKEELKNLKNSGLGEIVKHSKHSEKQGNGSASDLEDGTHFMVEMFNELKVIINQWIENKKKPMAFNQFVDGSHPIIQKGREQGHISDGMDMFDFEDDEDDFEGDLDLSDEELQELMDMFSGMMGQSAPKKRTRRK